MTSATLTADLLTRTEEAARHLASTATATTREQFTADWMEEREMSDCSESQWRRIRAAVNRGWAAGVSTKAAERADIIRRFRALPAAERTRLLAAARA